MWNIRMSGTRVVFNGGQLRRPRHNQAGTMQITLRIIIENAAPTMINLEYYLT